MTQPRTKPGRLRGTNKSLHLRTPDMPKTGCHKDPWDNIEWTGLRSFLDARGRRVVCMRCEEVAKEMCAEAQGA